MGTHPRPFQVAFRVLLVAFGLSLLVTMSNPRAVRLAILAPSQPIQPDARNSRVIAVNNPGSPPAATQRVANRSPRPAASGEPQPTLAVATPDRPGSPAASREPAAAVGSVPTAGVDDSDQMAVRQRDLAARRVSSAASRAENPANAAESAEVHTMPVLSPSALHASDKRHEYFELPPPPDRDDDSLVLPEGLALNATVSGASPSSILRDPASDRGSTSREREHHDLDPRLPQKLEAEIISLRREIDRLSESQQIASQLDRLERAHEDLLRLHQELPVDRMMQLLHLLLAEVQAVRETIPATFPPSPRRSRPFDPSLEGETSLTDRGRVSLRITDAQLEDVLRMLSRLSGTSIAVDPGLNQQDRPGDVPQRIEQKALRLPEAVSPATEFPLPIPSEPPVSSPPIDEPFPVDAVRQSIRQTAASSRCAQCHPHHIPR